MKKILILSICGLIFATNLNAQTWEIGYPNAADVIATLHNDTLTINGMGDILPYPSSQSVPWSNWNSQIRTAIIGDGVTRLIFRMFDWQCRNLISIEVGENNPTYSSINGVLFNKNQDTLIRYPMNRQGALYTIPDGVKTIYNSAFDQSRNLTSVIIPNSVVIIDYGAFMSISNLISVIIPNSVTTIGQDAFFRCFGLTSITIPSDVISIGVGAFRGCFALLSIEVDTNNPNYTSIDGVLFNKDQTVLIQYPAGKQGAYTIPNSVISIGAYAFWGCRNLTSVIIPNGVTSIGFSTFYNCSNLTSITIGSSIASIERNAFQNCSNLTSVIILSATPPTTQIDLFIGVNIQTANLYVLSASVSLYSTATIWKDFGNIIALDEEIFSLQDSILALLDSISTLLDNNLICQNEKSILFDSISTLQSTITNLNTIITAFQTENQTLQNEKTALQDTIDRLHLLLSLCDDASLLIYIETLYDSIDRINQKLVTLGNQNNTLNDSIATLNSWLTIALADISTLQNKNSVLHDSILTLLSRNSTLQIQNNTLQTTNNTLLDSISTLLSLNSILQNQNNALQTANSTLYDSIGRLHSKISSQNSTIIWLQNNNTALQTTNNNLHDSIGGLHVAHSCQINTLHDSIGRLHQHHTNYNNLNIVLNDSINNLRQIIVEWIDLTDDLLDTISWLRQALATCESSGTSTAQFIPTEQIQIYPNPVISELRIVIPPDLPANTVLELFDMNGRCVFSAPVRATLAVAPANNYDNRQQGRPQGSPLRGDTFVIDMTSFQPGNYILRIGNRVVKIVKQ